MPKVPKVEAVKAGQLVFRIHGPKDGAEERIFASVFAAKLATLVRALQAADRAVHGFVRHDYAIAKLRSSTPTVVLSEEVRPKYERELQIGLSGIDAFGDCADAISVGDRARALRYGMCPYYVQKLGRGASRQFGYAEIWTRQDNIIRVDPFLQEQAQSVVTPEKTKQLVPAKEEARAWFRGTTHGSFDGSVLEVDFRGALPALKLVLSAGGNEIDCVCREDHLEMIRAALKKRVRVFGDAIYDGKSGLPRRISVTDIQPVSGSDDFARWKGAFKPLDLPEWEGDDA
jgi:hypothetical protein